MEHIIGRFIDPLSDFGFKHLFRNEPNKDILIDFLNQLFKGQKEVDTPPLARYRAKAKSGCSSCLVKAS